MFGKTKKAFGRIKEDFKEGYERRRKLGKAVWTNFRNFTNWKGLQFDRKDYTFAEIQKLWGFGTGPGGLRRGLLGTGFMAVFFYLIFAWCAWYMAHSLLVLHNYISAASCALGCAVGFATGTVSLWRFTVFKKRKYVPFPQWIRGG